jgi:hypothetical protein
MSIELTHCPSCGLFVSLGDSNPPHMAEAIGRAIVAAHNIHQRGIET